MTHYQTVVEEEPLDCLLVLSVVEEEPLDCPLVMPQSGWLLKYGPSEPGLLFQGELDTTFNWKADVCVTSACPSNISGILTDQSGYIQTEEAVVCEISAKTGEGKLVEQYMWMSQRLASLEHT